MMREPPSTLSRATTNTPTERLDIGNRAGKHIPSGRERTYIVKDVLNVPKYRRARFRSVSCERELVKQRLDGIDFLEDVGERHEFRARQVRAYRRHKPRFSRRGHGSGIRRGPDEPPRH